MHPITKPGERTRWIREQIAGGKDRAELFSEIESFYPVKITLAKEIAMWLPPTLLSLYRGKMRLLAALHAGIAICIFVLQIQFDPHFDGNVLGLIDKVIFPLMFLVVAFGFFFPVSPIVWLSVVFSWLAFLYSLLVAAILFLLSPQGGDIASEGAVIALTLLSGTAIYLSRYLKKRMIPHYRLSGPKKDSEGRFLF